MAIEGPGLVQQTYALTDTSLEEWYYDIIAYLINHKYPTQMNPAQKWAFRLKFQCYMLQGSILHRRNHEGIYLRCVGNDEAKRIMEHFHSKFGIGHGGSQATTYHILRAGYYWPFIFKDAYEHVKTYHTCQVTTTREKNLVVPLQLITEVKPFVMWGLDFIGMINPPSSAQHRYILTETDYCTRCSEAQALKNCTTNAVIKFLEEHIITRFNCPKALVCDNGSAFTSLKFSN